MMALSHPPETSVTPITQEEEETLSALIIESLRTIYDPEISVNIYDLGLIYRIQIEAGGVVTIEMTLTSPACPVAQTLPGQVEQCIQQVPGVTRATVDLVWDPPWSPDCLSDEVKLQLGLL